MFSTHKSLAQRKYERHVLVLMSGYLICVCSSSFAMKRHTSDRFFFFFWAVLPALPVVGIIAEMGRYLREESDEYQRLVRMRSVLGGTGALLAVLVISDFLREFAGSHALRPFALFVVFCVSMALTEAIQRLNNRLAPDD